MVRGSFIKFQFLKTLIVWTLLVGCRSKKNVHTKPQYPFSKSEALTKPTPFFKGILTTNNGIAFSNDGNSLFISNPLKKKFPNGKRYMGIYEVRFLGETWGVPVKIALEIDAYHPVLSADNCLMFFNSRSHPDSTNVFVKHNIWFFKKTTDGWSTPQMVPGVNSVSYDSYPSLTATNDLYFNSDRPGGKGGMDIYVSRFVKGQYQQPVNLKVLNSEHAENDLVIDPYERFIIFNRYIAATKEIDLFISYRRNGKWENPKPLTQINKEGIWELTPTLSPDGMYFFYEYNNGIMQIDVSRITDITNKDIPYEK